ncbi:hypothetical protein [uncultured Porticoccus sp.]|uniref:hypothetical protein n=1 Tax=uncultured Porticoccus sp. TaxID=1256050 RepID=UPI0030DC01E2
MNMRDIPGWIEGLPVFEVLCERPNSTCPGYVLVIFWCKHCKRLHQHGSRRIRHEELMARAAHCGHRSPYKTYLLHRVPWQKTYTQDGITAPVLNVVGWWGGKARAICPKCCKTHVHHVEKGVEYTLVDGRCYPQYFVRQEGDV